MLPQLKKIFTGVVSDSIPKDTVDTDLVRLYMTHTELDVPYL